MLKKLIILTISVFLLSSNANAGSDNDLKLSKNQNKETLTVDVNMDENMIPESISWTSSQDNTKEEASAENSDPSEDLKDEDGKQKKEN